MKRRNVRMDLSQVIEELAEFKKFKSDMLLLLSRRENMVTMRYKDEELGFIYEMTNDLISLTNERNEDNKA